MRIDDAAMTRGRLITIQILSASGAGLNSLIPMAVSPALPAMALHFGGGAEGELAAKLVMSTPALSIAITSLFVGLIAQRFGYRTCMLFALGLFVLAGAAGLIANSMPALLASRVAIGVAGAFIGTITMALAGLFEARVRDRLIGFSSALGGGCSILGLSLGGAMVDAEGWRAPFILYLAGIPAFIAAWYAIRPQIGQSVGRPADAVEEAFPWRQLAPVYLLMLVMAIGFFTPGIHGPFLLAERGVTSATTQGMLISVFAATSAISAAGFGFIRPRLGERWIKVVMLLMIGGGLAGMAAATSTYQLVAALLVGGIGSGLATPQVTAMVIERTPPHRHAHALGLMYSAIFLGQFVNPLALDPLRLALGLSGMFLSFGLALMAAAMLTALLSSKHTSRVMA
ncbi:MFS transporter [Sphingomonas sp. DBB INV C78]|uniref:MFS transporter n=1 Tax=Sphingomonas sp. DBB INV C78 TaxID=3349434 RepID=UPI0036D23975